MNSYSRRDYLQKSFASLAFAAAAFSPANSDSDADAREPIKRSGPARFRPSIAAYSLREYFSYMKGKPQKPKADGKAIDMFGFIDYCASLNCDAAELTSYFMLPGADDGYLLELRQHAFLSGVTISGTAIGNDFTVSDPQALQSQIDQTISWIKKSSVLGAPHIRIFAGTAAQLGESEQKMNDICRAVTTCAKVAEQHGIFLGVENHGGISSKQLLEVISRIESSWVGVNLDTGNFVSEDPYQDIEACAPYSVNIQFKPSLRTPAGEMYQADFDRIAKILRDANYRGFVALEFEESDPYENIPHWLEKMTAALSSSEQPLPP